MSSWRSGSLRGPARRLVACLWLLLAFAAASAPAATAAGLSNNNALSELQSGGAEAESQTATTATTKTTSVESSTSSSTSRTLILGAIGVAVVLLAGIAFVIVRDARRVAPAGDTDLIEARAGHDAAVRLRKRRAKAKAARAQRRRNR